MSSSEESVEITTSSNASGAGYNDILSPILQLSDELEYFGLHPLPQLTNEEACAVLQTQVASLVNSLVDTVWNLLQFHRLSIRRCDEMGTRWNRAADDNKNLRAQVHRCKVELSSKEQMLSAIREKERRLTSECNKLQHDLRNVQDKVQRLMSHVTQCDRQHTHQLRKKEHEIVHIQEQLRHSLGLGSAAARHNHTHHKSNQNPACATCSGSTLHVSSNSEEGYSTIYRLKENKELYRKVISQFENSNQSLVRENIKLRETYCRLHTNLGFLTQQFTVLAEKYFECGKHEQKFEDSKNELKTLPPAASQMSYSGTKEYNEELHLMSDRYLATLQTVLEKLSNHLELQYSS